MKRGKPDSWCYMKQKDLFYLKKKKECEKSWENERSRQVLGAFQLVSERKRNCPKTDAIHTLHLQSERGSHVRKSLSSLRGIVKAVNVLAMRKQKIYLEHPDVWRPDRAQSNVLWEFDSRRLLTWTGNVSRRHASQGGEVVSEPAQRQAHCL